MLEAINYVSKISIQKVRVNSISAFLNNKVANSFDNYSIMKTLQEM